MKKLKSFIIIFFILILSTSLVGCSFSNNGINSNSSQNSVGNIKYSKIQTSERINMNVGDTFTTFCYGSPSNANEKVTLKTDNPDIVSISNNNEITALKAGTANIYYISSSGVKSNNCSVECFKINYKNSVVCNNTYTHPYLGYSYTYDINEVKDINFTVKTSSIGSLTINYKMKATRTYDESSSTPSVFNLKYNIYDNSNNVIKNGSVSSEKFKMGETVLMSGSIYITNYSDLHGCELRIELYNYKGILL